MKLLDGIYFSGMHLEAQERLNGNIKMSNENFVSIEESFETQRLCITTLNNLVEQQQKEIEELKDEAKADLDAIGHHHVRLTAIEESSKVTVHEVQQLKEESQAHFDAFAIHRTAIADLQTQNDTLTANLLDTVKSLTVFVKAVEMRLQSIEEKLTYDQETIAHLSSKVVELELVCQKVVASDLFK